MVSPHPRPCMTLRELTSASPGHQITRTPASPSFTIRHDSTRRDTVADAMSVPSWHRQRRYVARSEHHGIDAGSSYVVPHRVPRSCARRPTQASHCVATPAPLHATSPRGEPHSISSAARTASHRPTQPSRSPASHRAAESHAASHRPTPPRIAPPHTAPHSVATPRAVSHPRHAASHHPAQPAHRHHTDAALHPTPCAAAPPHVE